MSSTTTLAAWNAAEDAQAIEMLAGIYEHSPWIAQAVVARHPGPRRVASLGALKVALANTVRTASRERQLALIQAHPDLGGKAMEQRTLTAESTGEQQRAGLTACTVEELATIRRLNAAYRARFGHPFLLAVRGPRGEGLSKQVILDTFERRLHNAPEVEFALALRAIERIAEIRLNDRFGYVPAQGNAAWDWLQTPQDLGSLAREAQAVGFDEVAGAASGLWQARYHGDDPRGPCVRVEATDLDSGGAGGLGVAVAWALVQALVQAGVRLPLGIACRVGRVTADTSATDGGAVRIDRGPPPGERADAVPVWLGVGRDAAEPWRARCEAAMAALGVGALVSLPPAGPAPAQAAGEARLWVRPAMAASAGSAAAADAGVTSDDLQAAVDLLAHLCGASRPASSWGVQAPG